MEEGSTRKSMQQKVARKEVIEKSGKEMGNNVCEKTCKEICKGVSEKGTKELGEEK